MTHTPLTTAQIKQLENQGCSASDWKAVLIHPRTAIGRIQNARFCGAVTIGTNDSEIPVDGVSLPCGIYNAALADCEIGDSVRIANIGSVVANCRIGSGTVVQDSASLVAEAGASFGNGTEVDVVNEGGGRGVLILDDLTSQTAYLQAMRRHDPALTERLRALVRNKIGSAKSSRGIVGEKARIVHCGGIKNVHIGPHAFLHGVQRLEDGTILSCAEHPTEVGEGVNARHFIVAEGASIDGGVILDKAFVGQAARLGKQFSAENSLFFANCEGFHGEAVSLFAGPYTVSHHKSTLLIAGIASFYNAGSGTNQSNHMYKLGPVHQGVFERGCKTGSFSYVLYESQVGAFSVVIGKHLTNINTPNLPFSYLSEEAGTSRLVPAMNLFSVGTVRDGEKWPKRDNRKAPRKRDLIVFDVFSPYTVEKMRNGRDDLARLGESVAREKDFVAYNGVQISRLLLRKGSKYYAGAVTRYLTQRACAAFAAALERENNWKKAAASLAPRAGLANPLEWTDCAGLLTARERIEAVEEGIRTGTIRTYDELVEQLKTIRDRYEEDEWQYVSEVIAREEGMPPHEFTRQKALEYIDLWRSIAASHVSSILEDAKREFGPASRIGYGLDLPEAEKERDFESVRGSAETNSVTRKLSEELRSIQARAEELTARVDAAVD